MTDGLFADTATLTADRAARLHASNIRTLRQRLRLHDAERGHGPEWPSTAGMRQELADEIEMLGCLQAGGDDLPYELADDSIPPRLLALPAGSTPTSLGEHMSTTGETYTHRSWLDWAEGCLDSLRTLRDSLDQMCAQIAADDGDQAQIEAIRTWQAQIDDTIAGGQQMVEQVNARQVPVGEAVATAGGSENTPHKQYADEARSV
ncbi:MAG: hypothetical protein ACRDRJ_33485 [Streptosporangiaceae bacterium]